MVVLSRVLRALLAISASGCAFLAIEAIVWKRQQCNRLTQYALRVTEERTARRSVNLHERAAVRDLIRRLSECRNHFPTDTNVRMLLAANLQLVGNYEGAIQEYREALAHDRRPELFLNLGLAQLAIGDRRAAEENLTTMAYLSLGFMEDIPEPLRSAVYARVSPFYAAVAGRTASSSMAKEIHERVARPPW